MHHIPFPSSQARACTTPTHICSIMMESKSRNLTGRTLTVIYPRPLPTPKSSTQTTPLTLDFNYKTPKSKEDDPEMLIPSPT